MKIQHVSPNRYHRPQKGVNFKKTSITIHNTSNPKSTAQNERDWLENSSNTRYASFHYVVDAKEVIECIPPEEIAYHCGVLEGNRHSIGIEICESGDYEANEDNAVKFIAQLLKDREWNTDRLRTHKSWSGKNCPRRILHRWGDFIDKVKQELGEGTMDWKDKLVKDCIDDGLLTDTKWIDKKDEPMSVWAVCAMFQNLINKEDKSSYKYEVQGVTHIVKIDPKKIRIVMPNKSIGSISPKNAINGTFFWDGRPAGILVDRGDLYSMDASHAWRGYPQSVLYLTDKGEVKVSRIKHFSEIGEKVVWAIGGCGLITPYGYDPSKEGFVDKYSDILRTTNKTFIGYKKDENRLYMCLRPDSSHDRIIESCKNLGLDLAISLDGGGSSCLKVDGDIKAKSDRRVNNYIVW